MTDDRAGRVPWVFEETVGNVPRRAAARAPDRDALVFPAPGIRWSWRELDERVDRIAAALVAIGVGPGEHVGIWSMNEPEWALAQYVAGRIGAVLVNVNPGYRLFELAEALAAADVATLIVGSPFKGSNFVAMVEELCPEAAAARARDWASARLPRLRRLIALGSARPGPGWWSWSELEAIDEVSARAERDRRAGAVRPGDVHNIQFTSGTTGAPKGAMLTHRNVLMNAYYTGERLRFTADDRLCLPVPFYHCFGCVLGTMVCGVYGAALVVPSPSFDAEAVLKAIDAERCTAVYGVPTMFVGMLERPDFARYDLSGLRTGLMSGAPCPLPLMKKVIERMGASEICIGYGQTEASPIITLTDVDDPIEVRVGTVGRPIGGLEVRLVDPATDRVVGDDQDGELQARGHCVMAGYYRNPEATARSVDAEGWLHTGDLARRRADGNYRIVGRSKELIIRGGENIYPPEVEEFLHHHPAVAEAAVAGLPDGRYGEVVAAWVVLAAGASATPDELIDHCRGRIAHFKVPKHVLIVEALPRTVTGKVRKHILKDNAVLDLGLGDAERTETA